LVSVVIPCYKQAHFLSEAIESVLRQTYPAVEIIVVDDGSPDDTAEVASRYQRIRCIRQENQGIAGARNMGYRTSTGAYLIFLDADDRLTPTAVETHLRCFSDHPDAGFVVGDIDHIAADGSYLGSPRWPLLEADYYEQLLRVNHVANTIAVMFRRDTVETAGAFKSFFTPAEDYELLLSAARSFPSAHHRDVVALYRRHHSSQSRQGVIMLRATRRVMESVRPSVGSNRRLGAAHREGEIYWREHFGAVTIKEIYTAVRRGNFFHAARACVTLVSHVRGRLAILPWKRRKKVLNALRRRLPLIKTPSSKEHI
jgi:glycosyltransferase involved in cell wall biosynthesis